MVDLTRRQLLSTSAAAALGASVFGVASGKEVEETDTPGAPSVKGSLKRFSTTAFGAEVTGPFVFEDGSLLYSLQHPEGENPEPFGRAAVGYFSGFQFEFDGSNDDFSEIGIPDTEEKQRQVRSEAGDYEILVQGREPINDGEERLGVPQTPDGIDITTETFDVAKGGAGQGPDCNQFVATNDEGTEGYLFTNWENVPGSISRVPLNQDENGEWSADPDAAMNLVNTEAFRDIGGTRTNCYGDLSPWNTMISAEENYAHPRLHLGATVGDIVEAGSGTGLLGGCQFWNRPQPAGISNAISTYAENGDIGEAWTPQGAWSQLGNEGLAYHLGAEHVDDRGDGDATTPIDDVYPNPYRYGYFVDIREPAADTPQPIKYWVMGRAAWEAPDIQGDRKTVYMCSDGDSKGVYKFVADEPIDGYENTDDIAGTLYAPKITNDSASAAESDSRNSPAQTPLDVEWLELGHATNGELESWIDEYDDVTQADYLSAHTDWEEGDEVTGEIIKQADLEVIENGNQNYITNEEIVEWAKQYEANGPDGVDEELRRVPFLEARAAAKEIGASIEFNKAEGVDSVDDSQPGDFVYFGISEFNDALADDEGDIQLDRVDGGVVYRGVLESDYNVSTLEPVITGPDFTDSPEDADDALRNIDNVYTMRDGRVLCCEDGFGGPARSYPNDGLYVYQPNVIVGVGSAAVGGSTGSVPLTASSLPAGFSGARLTVSVSNPEIASLTGVSFPDALGLTESAISDDGSSATIRVADVDTNVQSGAMDVELATLDVRADGGGTTDLTVSVDQMDDENGNAIDAETRNGLVVGGPQTVVGDAAPTDPDGDGRFEDLNGNGRLDYEDVQVLFANMDSDSVRLNTGAYDFNENGKLDFADVTALYEEVN